MTPLGLLLREEICRNGPISFHGFMEAALYHPEYGYYRKAQDPFGKYGDYYTAEQLQPVFGTLIAARIRALYREMGSPTDFAIVELGAGRKDMAAAFSEWRYLPVDVASGVLPDRFSGVVFSNEFFDALPVHVVIWTGAEPRKLLVGFEAGRFVWVQGDRAGDELESYLGTYFPALEEGRILEINLDALRWLERIAQALDLGYVFTIDYGYTVRESKRFQAGTLMSYRRHVAQEDVLQDPGERDISAHVCFTALEQHGGLAGLETRCFETLAQTLLRAGEEDQFQAALAAPTREQEVQHRLQLKTLLFGMGEEFRTLLQKKRKL